MPPADLAPYLRALGFTDGDWFRDLTDRPVKGMVYLTRTYQDQRQQLSLLSGPWEGAPFTEAVLLVYERPFDPRAKVRQTPLCARTIRGGLEEVLSAVSTVYSPLPKP